MVKAKGPIMTDQDAVIGNPPIRRPVIGRLATPPGLTPGEETDAQAAASRIGSKQCRQ